ncbi:MAG: phage baseplate assembly protein V [Lachnospiraceae bacterium]|nr:phage baseplate assembly protein V [Lachnospiraceae bacterium]
MYEDMIRTLRTQPTVSSNPGLVVGTVRKNYDAKEPGKVMVEYSLGENGKMLTGWVAVLSPYTTDKGGMYLLPEIGDEVVLGFLEGRTDCPIVLGSLWSKSVNRPQNAVNEKNTMKMFRTKGGHEVSFSEESKKETITVTTPGGLTVLMADEKKTIEIRDKDKKNSVIINGQSGEIKVDAQKKVVLSVGGTAAVTIESNKVTIGSGTVSIDGKQSLKLHGQSAALQGSQVSVKADGSLGVESSGVTQVKGSMVKIN